MPPHFTLPIRVPLTNARTGAPAFLVSGDAAFPETDVAVARITAICNESDVYRFLFNQRLEGAPYPPDMARGYLAFARAGWAENRTFVFFMVDAEGTIAGTVDIRTDDLESAEIGYWLSAQYSGLMTPAVQALLPLARAAGYSALHAWVNPSNTRSAAVLTRAGFRAEGLYEHLGEQMFYFTVDL